MTRSTVAGGNKLEHNLLLNLFSISYSNKLKPMPHKPTRLGLTQHSAKHTDSHHELSHGGLISNILP
jgi:hypothetical protein